MENHTTTNKDESNNKIENCYLNNNNYILLKQFEIKNLKNIKNLDMLNLVISQTTKEFYTNYSSTRKDAIKDICMKGINIIDDNLTNKSIYLLSKNENSFLTFAKAWLFDKLPEYSKTAEDSANKSIKLNPFLPDSYNCIAHIMWKKGDLEQAFNYFKQALSINKNDINTLRNLSMIIRAKNFNSINNKNNEFNQNKNDINANTNLNNKFNDNKSLNSNSTNSNKKINKFKNVKEDINKPTDNIQDKLEKAEESLKYAKLAVDLDIKDSYSWYVLGNGYFHYAFLELKNQYDYLKKAVNSYNMSEKHQNNTNQNPDLYYNRANVSLFLENYSKAVEDLKVSNDIDESLQSGQLAENVIDNILILNKQIKGNCNIKSKKLNYITQTIPVNLNSHTKYSLIEAKITNTNELNNKNMNSESKYLISAKVIQIADKCTNVPTSLICVDHNSNFFMLSVYNISQDFKTQIIPMNSLVTILDPKIIKFSFNYNNKIYEHVKVEVTDTNKLLLNGKYCSCYSSIIESSSTFFL